MSLPKLSVILAVTDGYPIVRRTLRHLAAQTIATDIEMVFVADSSTPLNVPEQVLSAFHSWQSVQVGKLQCIGQANAAGVLKAKAEIIALAEDHCFPEPSWAAHLLKAQEGEWAAVGPAVMNANPDSAVSWADFFLGYGPWASPCISGDRPFLPGHNSSYKRAALLSYGADLGKWLATETLMQWDMRSRGKRLYLEAGAVSAHTNFSLWRVFVKVQYLVGRSFGGSRFPSASLGKRVLWFCASPLIPWVRLARLIPCAARGGLLGPFTYCLPALLIGLAIDGAGQAVGYLLGPGRAQERLTFYEFRRVLHVNKHDRASVFGEEL